jgi:hypothetical protein
MLAEKLIVDDVYLQFFFKVRRKNQKEKIKRIAKTKDDASKIKRDQLNKQARHYFKAMYIMTWQAIEI